MLNIALQDLTPRLSTRLVDLAAYAKLMAAIAALPPEKR
jgi:hypothetical protein